MIGASPFFYTASRSRLNSKNIFMCACLLVNRQSASAHAKLHVRRQSAKPRQPRLTKHNSRDSRDSRDEQRKQRKQRQQRHNQQSQLGLPCGCLKVHPALYLAWRWIRDSYRGLQACLLGACARSHALKTAHVPGGANPADLFTKCHPGATFNKLVKLIKWGGAAKAE
jgi:hypothetical protein